MLFSYPRVGDLGRGPIKQRFGVLCAFVGGILEDNLSKINKNHNFRVCGKSWIEIDNYMNGKNITSSSCKSEFMVERSETFNMEFENFGVCLV